VKIRSRALLTTLWARLVLGDLFLHGIGGAKYDQVTDVVIERFFGAPPPEMMVVSATLHLPIRRPRPTLAQLRGIDRELRDLTWHPERHWTAAAPGCGPVPDDAGGLLAAKQRWIDTPQTPENALLRWQSLRQVNEALQPWVAQRRQALLAMREKTARALRGEEVLASREFGFCLYPEKTLREFFAELLPKNA
jgi:hypothetical protein